MSDLADQELEKTLQARLATLRTTLPRDVQKAAHNKAVYLAHVQRLHNENLTAQPVSVSWVERLIKWISQSTQAVQTNRKERKPMFSAIVTTVITLALLVGGAGATTYAAQASLPDETMYPIKTLSEDIRLNLTVNPQRQIDLALGFADERIEEILTLRASGEPLPPEVMLRLFNQLNLALCIASELEDDQSMQKILEQIGIHIRQQDRDMIQGRAKMPEGLDPAMQQVQAILRLQAGLAEDGLVNPTSFRLRMRANQVIVTETVIVTEPVAGSEQPAAAVSETPLPPGNSFGPRAGTPAADGSGYGSGPGAGTPACGGCTPRYDGSGPGPKNDGTTTQPTQGYGPGPGPGAANDDKGGAKKP
jgi:hypothetical protein